ncbi:MAG: hypothetical protein KKI04_02190, partial [Proteobacteria bacterium]|nr:hypothetical protein [Pseudomonadota bacterium]
KFGLSFNFLIQSNPKGWMMRELPEVETLCRQLNAILPGKEILNVEILDPCLGKMEALAGRRVAAAGSSARIGK